jgi:hypothetical protein
MNVGAYLLGDPGRLPFIGHFRVVIQTESITLAAAGRVGARDGTVPGFRAARLVEGALHGIKTEDLLGRNDLLLRAWTTLLDIDRCDLGPSDGADFSILLAARDSDGMGIAGTGLGGVWGANDSTLIPLVEGDHPLLKDQGLPLEIPGVLTLDVPLETVYAVPAHLEPMLPSSSHLLARCGVH